MAVPDFADLLKQTMGLDAASIGPEAIMRAVDERQVACGLNDQLAYWDLVRSSRPELQALIEAVVVSETWFFRDRGAFALLGRMVLDEWLPAHPDGVLRLLSLPSSTGEEPYSIAMTLLDAGVPASRFRVHALDISARALASAGRAVYGKNSFRGHELTFRTRHFDLTPSGYRLSDIVRGQVDFEQRNLLASDAAPAASYDVIFCRNLLIYFDRGTQERAIAMLARLLTPTGVLFVAPSEAGLLLTRGFASMKVPMAFAFRKAGHGPNPAPRRTAPVVRRRPAAAPRTTSAVVVSRTPPPRIGGPVDPNAALEQATRLANQGLFREAATCCEESLRRNGPSAEIFHLLGMVRDASGDRSEAAKCYRKALYLDPNHRDVLIHFALLMENLGQKGDAQVLWQRARRLDDGDTHG